jgi:hypothetical protein
MLARMTSAKILATVILSGLFLLMLPGTGNACRMYGIIGNDLPADLLQSHLISAPNSLEALSHSQLDGWGIAYYPQYGNNPTIARSAIRAYNDPNYDTVVATINASTPQITVAHIRTCASGCCSHDTDTIPNPHPFYRVKNSKTWVFAHNGVVSKDRMNRLLEDYLIANPPNGSDVPSCDPSNPNLVVDTELYFLFVLKKIEKNGWNAVNGIVEAVKAMVDDGETGAMNFIMSDGETVWAFRKGGSSYTLYYLNAGVGTANGYAAVASQYPSSSQGSWVMITDFHLVVMTRNAAPVVINDVRTYCPGDINKNGQANAADLEAFALNFGGSGSGDLNFNGVVDGSDLAALAVVYGKTCP